MNESSPLGIAVDATYVYWVNFGDATVHRAKKDGTGGKQTLYDNDGGVLNSPRDCIVDNNFLYVTDDFNGIYRVPNSGGTPTVVSSTANCTCYLQMDGTHLYWSSYNGNDITKALKTTTTGGTQLVSAQNGPLFMWLDTPTNVLYWPNSGSGVVNNDGTLGKVSTDGGNPTTIASALVQPEALTVAGSHVFWISNGTLVDGGGTNPSTGTLTRVAK
jgi:hypothetical protein